MAEAAELVWLRGPAFGCKALRVTSTLCSVRDFIHRHCQDQVVPLEYFFVKCNGLLVNASFGSMLRALGAQIEKTTNREACRDLSGRRLRDVNHEKAMAEWVKQQAEREAEKEQKRLERLQRKLAEPRHCFTSPDYQQQCHEMAERLEDSVLKGMQAASSKVVSAEIGEHRKRPYKSKTDRGASAGKRKCFWLGMDGLETAEGSSSESSDEDSEEAPGSSGVSFPVPPHGSDGVAMAAKLPSSSQQARVLVSTDPRSSEKLPTPVTDSREGISEDLCAELGEASTEEEHVERKTAAEIENTQEQKETETEEPREKEAAGVGVNKEQETQGMADGEGAAVGASGGDGGDVPVARREESQAESTDFGQETIDLLAFNSVADLELLGLEKLKCELMALGLKCGGTLHERAARLFSVRGLAREQIDPALFAKPSKGKKK
uniref:Replication stress response regulator SDE2 n=1 Tax=Sus scrofa TaxID=9823 RepID=A0A8D1CAV5_PIG